MGSTNTGGSDRTSAPAATTPADGSSRSFGSRLLGAFEQRAPLVSGLVNGVTGSDGTFGSRLSAFLPQGQGQQGTSAYTNMAAGVSDPSVAPIDPNLMSQGTGAMKSGSGGGMALLKMLLA